MVSNRLSAKAREYMRTHPGVKYQQALAAVTNELPDSVTFESSEFLRALGISDLKTYDPRKLWKSVNRSEGLRIPIGYATGDAESTDAFVYLDLNELSAGGTGPHGCIQGVTGSGKSYLLREIVLSLTTNYGPELVSLVLADFKGGATFAGLEKLPHVEANLTNLYGSIDRVHRLGRVIETEMLRRESILHKNGCRDFREYRRSVSDKDIPAMTELVVIIDEFHEFMASNRGYLNIMTRIGAKGRSLGIHIIAASQLIDPSLLPALMNHLTFGISLRCSSPHQSRVVLDGDPSAANLPIGRGHGMFRSSDPNGHASVVQAFRVFNKDENDDALIEKLSNSVERTTSLWGEPLTTPLTWANGSPWWNRSNKILSSTEPLNLVIGELDDVSNRRRTPYNVSVEGNVLVVGDSNSGKTTALMSMVASAAASNGIGSSWRIVDTSGKMRAVSEFPNVSAYSGADLSSMVEDLYDLVSARKSLIDEGMSLNAYFEKSKSDASRVVLVIDNLDSYGKDSVREITAREKLSIILNTGPKYGVHVVASAKNALAISHSYLSSFGEIVRLGPYRADSDSVISLEHKEYLRRIPEDQPGRGFDVLTGMEFVIAVPILDEIPRLGGREYRGPSMVYDYHGNHSDKIRDLGLKLSEVIGLKVPAAERLGKDVSYTAMKSVFDTDKNVSLDSNARDIPFAVSAHPLKAESITKQSPHLVVIETRETCATVFRTLMASVTDQFSANEAQIIVIDPEFHYVNDVEALMDAGFMSENGYAVNHEEVSEVVEGVIHTIGERIPTGKSIRASKGGKWFDGPEVFLFIDIHARDFDSLDRLVSGLTVTSNLGVHVVVATTDEARDNQVVRKLTRLSNVCKGGRLYPSDENSRKVAIALPPV